MSKAHPLSEKSINVAITENQVALSGCLLIDTLMQLRDNDSPLIPNETSSIDISALSQLDTAGAWFLVDQRRQASQRGIVLAITGATAAQAQLLRTVEQNMPTDHQPLEHSIRLVAS
jgi:phospholipid/cholesterol/gamma-HCH transport system permease protein